MLLVLCRAVSYHFVPGVTLKDFGAKAKDGKEDLISTNDKEPSILKTGGAEGFHMGGASRRSLLHGLLLGTGSSALRMSEKWREL